MGEPFNDQLDSNKDEKNGDGENNRIKVQAIYRLICSQIYKHGVKTP